MIEKKRKSEIEKEFRAKLFGEFLSQYDLIISRTYASSYEIRNKKEKKENILHDAKLAPAWINKILMSAAK